MDLILDGWVEAFTVRRSLSVRRYLAAIYCSELCAADS